MPVLPEGPGEGEEKPGKHGRVVLGGINGGGKMGGGKSGGNGKSGEEGPGGNPPGMAGGMAEA